MAKQPRELSEKSLRLRAASRDDDGFFSTFVLRKISRRITSILVETSIKPNFITFLSIVIGLLAALCSAQGRYLLGGLLLLASLVFDCIDGEIARYKSQFSALGAWLDALSDRVKEFAYIAGLIYSLHEEKGWWIGMAIVILQTIRHLSDYNFVRTQKLFEDNSILKHNRKTFLYWIKKIINLPIGERWLLLAILPLVISVTTTLRVALYLSMLSFVIVIFSRLKRIRKWKVSNSNAQFMINQRDTVLPLSFRNEQIKIAWSFPSILRALEFLALVVMPLDISPLTRFSLICSISIWHYTNLYDALQDRVTKFGGAGLRMAGRISLIFIAHLVGLDFEITAFMTIYLITLVLLRGGQNVVKGVS